MALTLTLTLDTNGNLSHWSDTKRLHLIGTIAATGSYTTNGVALSFANPLIKSNTPPIWTEIKPRANQYRFTYLPATGKVLVYDTSGAEISAAAFPAGILADVMDFYGIFVKFI